VVLNERLRGLPEMPRIVVIERTPSWPEHWLGHVAAVGGFA
jgi:hypothetical protein